jgi:hypothetical protein
MFKNALKFNKYIGSWDMSKVIMTNDMFCNAKEFNQPLDKWDVQNVKYMSGMFIGCPMSNDISMWRLNRYCDISNMFDECLIPDTFKPSNDSLLLMWKAEIYTYMDPCPICYTDIVKEEWCATRCSNSTPEHYHAFHKECINSWLNSHNICPYCREAI